MSKPFRFRYVRPITGLFVLLALGLLVGLIVLASRAQGWLEPRMILHIRLPEEGSFGLKVGSEVEMLGTVIGSIERMKLSEAGQMEAVAILKGDFITFVRQDSKVVIKKKFHITGDAFAVIESGKGEALDPGSATLSAVIDEEIVSVIQKVVEEVRPVLATVRAAADEYRLVAEDLREGRVTAIAKIGAVADEYRLVAQDLRDGWVDATAKIGAAADEYGFLARDLREGQVDAIAKIGTAADEYGRLAADLRSREGPIYAMTDEMQELLLDARQGDGTVGRLLQDRALFDQLSALVAEMRTVAENLRQTSEKLPALAARLDRDYAKLPATVQQAQQALLEAEDLVTKLSNHWLLGGGGESQNEGKQSLPSKEWIVP